MTIVAIESFCIGEYRVRKINITKQKHIRHVATSAYVNCSDFPVSGEGGGVTSVAFWKAFALQDEVLSYLNQIYL